MGVIFFIVPFLSYPMLFRADPLEICSDVILYYIIVCYMASDLHLL